MPPAAPEGLFFRVVAAATACAVRLMLAILVHLAASFRGAERPPPPTAPAPTAPRNG